MLTPGNRITADQGAGGADPWPIESADGGQATLGATTDAEAASGNGTAIAILKNLRTRLEALEDHVDGVETLIGTIIGHIDGIETALAGTLDAQGNVAHGTTDAGNPVKVGMRAVAHGTNPAEVDAGQRTDLLAGRHGVPFILGGHPNILTLRANYTGAETNTAIVTVGAGVKIGVTQLTVVSDDATSVKPSVLIGFGATTTPTGAGVVGSHPGVPPGGGFVRGDGSGILGIGAAGEDLRITSEVPTDGSIDVLVSYFTITEN